MEDVDKDCPRSINGGTIQLGHIIALLHHCLIFLEVWHGKSQRHVTVEPNPHSRATYEGYESFKVSTIHIVRKEKLIEECTVPKSLKPLKMEKRICFF